MGHNLLTINGACGTLVLKQFHNRGHASYSGGFRVFSWSEFGNELWSLVALFLLQDCQETAV